MLSEIFKKNRIGILATYCVLAFENLLFALYPWLFGRSIDGLLADDYSFFHFYIGIFFVGILVGVGRRMFDTRIFSKVWLKVSTDVISELMDKEVESSKVITRGSLSCRYVDFFEFNIPDLFRGVVTLVIAIVMLWLALTQVIGWILLLAAMAIIYSHWVSMKTKKYDHLITDTVDESNQAIQDSDKEGVMAAYESRTKSYITMSDWHAVGWGLPDLLWLATEVVAVLALIKMNCTTGQILATTAYVGMLYGNIMVLSHFFINLRAIEVANEKIEDCRGSA